MANRADQAGRTYGGRTAEERQALQRRLFLDAGLRLFGTVGYRNTTVRALCREAGLTDRYFYRNFDDMQACLLAVYAEAVGGIEARVVDALASEPDDADAAIVAGLTAFFESFEDPRVARVAFLEVLGVGPEVDAAYARCIQRFVDLFVAFVHARGGTRVDATQLQYVAVGLVGAVIQSSVHWLLSDYAVDRAQVVAANARILSATIGAL